MTRPRGRRTTHDELARAAAALERARSSGADPWRVEELRLRYEDALQRALDQGPDVALATVPAPRRREPPLPLEWVDESGRTRRGPAGEPS